MNINNNDSVDKIIDEESHLIVCQQYTLNIDSRAFRKIKTLSFWYKDMELFS